MSNGKLKPFVLNFPPVDIFISHNSPAGIHDRQDDVHYGFSGLNKYIVRAQPPLLVHGHQHVNQESFEGKTRIVGAYGFRVIELTSSTYGKIID